MLVCACVCIVTKIKIKKTFNYKETTLLFCFDTKQESSTSLLGHPCHQNKKNVSAKR